MSLWTRLKPGFREWPDSFKIYRSELDEGGWEEGFVTFEEAWAALPDPDDPEAVGAAAGRKVTPANRPQRTVIASGRHHDSDRPSTRLVELFHFQIAVGEPGDVESEAMSAKHIGYYSSEAAARGAIEIRRPCLGFRDWPDGFRSYPVEVDRIGWPDGFTDAEADRSYWRWPQQEIAPE